MKLTPQQDELVEFVASKHGEQVRKYTGEVYVAHLLSVAHKVQPFDREHLYLVEIALGHDLFEDTNCSRSELTAFLTNSGYSEDAANKIVNGIVGLTDVYTKEAYPDLNRAARKEKEAYRLGRENEDIQTVKYADLIDNTCSIVKYDPAFAKVYLLEKREILSRMRKGEFVLYAQACYVLNRSLIELGMAEEVFVQ
jgi:(p)ppGpp synthase/HD superfamily hydrolase